MKDLRKKCQVTYKALREFRDIQDEFDYESDHGYVEWVVTKLQDEARKLGCVTEMTPSDGLNAVAEIIDWAQSRSLTETTPANDRLPSADDLKDWYTTTELAELLGKQPFTIREQWCNNSRIECEKDPDSRKWRIPGHEVKRLLSGGILKPRR